MARKFLYLVAFAIVLTLGVRLALTFYPDALSRAAFEPAVAFAPRPALPADAYDRPEMWLARPGNPANPTAFVPDGAPAAPPPVAAAVFFVHPTSFLMRSDWNAALDEPVSRRYAGVFVRGLASPFAGAAQVWAPRYRQAALGAFLSEKRAGQDALDLAYRDVAQAFAAFLRAVPPDLPIVLAGHSQGAYHLKRLLAEQVAGKPLARRIAAAYLVGWPLSPTHDLPMLGLPACSAPDQPGCVASWLSFAEPAEPGMMRAAWERRPGSDGQPIRDTAIVCFNPLTGATGGTAPASANPGTLVPDLSLEKGVLKPGLVGASCRRDGLLAIGEAPAMGPYVGPGNNYHVYDIPLFWAALRADYARRVAAWRR